MGVAITPLLTKETITVEQLAGKILVVDAYNILYQFLTTIRTPDGTPLRDEHGRITSHLVGLFSRTSNLLAAGVRLVFVFDGPKPVLKASEIERRKARKDEAAQQYADAVAREDTEAMKKFSARTVSLTQEMVAEAQELLRGLGVPIVQAASEAEAQAARYVREGYAYAVVSQDADCLLFGAPRMIRNLSITGRRKKPGTPLYITIEPEMVVLEKLLSDLQFTQDQLIALGMLVGTDFNPGGIKGIGPKKALKLVRELKDPAAIFAAAEWDAHQAVSWQEVFDLLKHMPTHPPERPQWGRLDRPAVEQFLRSRGFSTERLTILDKLGERQQGLGEFF